MLDYSSVTKRVGLAAIGTAGLLSAVTTCVLLCYMAYCLTPGARKSPLTIGVRNFVRSTLGKYLVALLVSDFVQGTAFAINYHWARIGAIHEGSAICIAQGSVSQVGDLGTALITLAITFHTFWLLFLQRKPAEWVCHATLIVVGVFVLIMPVIGSHVIPQAKGRGEFWGRSGAWCWIGDGYQLERFMYVYTWVFLNLICSAVIYSLIYLKFMGVIDYLPTRRDGPRLVFHGWRSASRHQSSTRREADPVDSRGNSNHVSQALVKIARRLTWYPIVYAMVVVPLSICRLGILAGMRPPFGLYVFAGVCFSSSGLTNALLFVFTRHAFIQRIARPAGITITTHQFTVIEITENPALKSYSLDQLQSKAAPRPRSDTSAFEFEGEAGDQKPAVLVGEGEEAGDRLGPAAAKGMHPSDWANTP